MKTGKMKEKPPNKVRQAEWEEFLKANQQLPIYMGDHMTRRWTKAEQSAADSEEERTRNSIRRTCTRADSQASKIVPSRPSHYSSRKLPNGKKKLKSPKEILTHHNITKDDMLKWQESFDALLNSSSGLYVFTIFLESEIADENLKFWLACEDLKHSKQKKQEKRVQHIYDTFINVYSPHEINIDYKMREDIVEQLKSNVDVSVFTEAQHQVYTLMHRDSYPRFLSSPFKAELMDALLERCDTDAKLVKTTKEPPTRSTGGLISCCYCRRQDSEQDIANLVEEQHTASTSVANKSMDVPASCERADIEIDDRHIRRESNPSPRLRTPSDELRSDFARKNAFLSDSLAELSAPSPETTRSYENPTMKDSVTATETDQCPIDS